MALTAKQKAIAADRIRRVRATAYSLPGSADPVKEVTKLRLLVEEIADVLLSLIVEEAS